MFGLGSQEILVMALFQMSQHFAQEMIPLTSILSHKGRGSKVNDWRCRFIRERKQGWAMTGDAE